MLALLLCLAPVPPDPGPAVGPGTRFQTYGVLVEVCAIDPQCQQWKPQSGCYCLWNVTDHCWLTRYPPGPCCWSWTAAEVRAAVRTGSLP